MLNPLRGGRQGAAGTVARLIQGRRRPGALAAGVAQGRGLLADVRAERLGVKRRLELRCLLLCVRSGWACGGDWGARRRRRLGCVRSCCSSSAQRKNLGAQRRNGSPVMKRKRDQVGQLEGRKRLWASRAAVALPAQTSSSSESLEEKRETQKGKSEEEEMYERVLEGDPRNVEALKVVVYGKMRRRETKEAGLALVMHKRREGPAVFVMLDKALKIAHREKRVIEERNIRILIAQMHVVKGQLEEGLNLFQDLVTEDPRDFRPYLCQGIIYSLLDQKKEAAEQFEIYRALVPEEVSQKGFLDDVVLAAKMKPGEQLQKEFEADFSSQK
ncbi:hypothetical protein ACLB2K_007732 [Fragaria x ananassa]